MRQTGYSIVEVMISMTLGLILIAGVIELYVGSKKTYRTQDAMARLQESARFALDSISHELRMVGYAGCKRLGDISVNEVDVDFDYSGAGAFWGNQSLGIDGESVSGTLPANLEASDRVPHTDVFQVQSAGHCNAPLTNDMNIAVSAIPIHSANHCNIAMEDTVIISDCESADMFQVKNVPNNNLQHLGISKPYQVDDGSEILTFSSKTFFVGEENGLPSLFFIDNTQSPPDPVVLVQGVENMQVQYGVDTDGSGAANIYANANGVTDWTNVVSARITLLMRTVENLNAQGLTFDVGGTNVDYDGGPIRQEYVSTVTLRNRTL